MFRYALFAAVAVGLLLFMLWQVPSEMAVLKAIDHAIREDEECGGSDAEHDANVPERVLRRLAAVGTDTPGASIFAGEGIIAIQCPLSGKVRNIKDRALRLASG